MIPLCPLLCVVLFVYSSRYRLIPFLFKMTITTIAKRLPENFQAALQYLNHEHKDYIVSHAQSSSCAHDLVILASLQAGYTI